MSTAANSASSPKVFALSKAFALQYASLILIMLAAVAGSFARGSEEQDELRNAAATSLIPAPKELAALEYPHFFSPGGEIIDLDAFAAIQKFMQEHDVDAQLVLGANIPNLPPKIALASALFRGQAVKNMLIKSGIPQSAMKVFAAESLSPEALRVDLTAESKEVR